MYKEFPCDFNGIVRHCSYRHRAINIFARTYYELWLQDENVGQEVMIEDLTVIVPFSPLDTFITVLIAE